MDRHELKVTIFVIEMIIFSAVVGMLCGILYLARWDEWLQGIAVSGSMGAAAFMVIICAMSMGMQIAEKEFEDRNKVGNSRNESDAPHSESSIPTDFNKERFSEVK